MHECHSFFRVLDCLQSESVTFDLNLCVLVCESFHAEEPGYSAGGCRNRHPSERADEAHPKTYGTISCSHLNCLCVGFWTLLCFFGFLLMRRKQKRGHVSHFVSPAGNPRLRLCHHKQRLHPDAPGPQASGNPRSWHADSLPEPCFCFFGSFFCPRKLMHNRVRKETSLVGRCAGLV